MLTHVASLNRIFCDVANVPTAKKPLFRGASSIFWENFRFVNKGQTRKIAGIRARIAIMQNSCLYFFGIIILLNSKSGSVSKMDCDAEYPNVWFSRCPRREFPRNLTPTRTFIPERNRQFHATTRNRPFSIFVLSSPARCGRGLRV